LNNHDYEGFDKTGTRQAPLIDYHVHPGYSLDAAHRSIRDYCRRALELGLKEICFTTHLENEPDHFHTNNEVRLHGRRVPSYQLHWLEEYFKEIERARDNFTGDGLIVKAGIEIGYSSHLEEFIERVLTGFPFDFVLGAIHSVQGTSISNLKDCPEYFRLCTLEDLREDYFGTLENAVKSGFFDCLAHVDLYRRYGYDFYGEDIYTIHRGFIEPIFEEAARRRTGLEINTSTARRGIEEFHPTREILQLAVEAGIEIFTVGSDAHSLDELGDHVSEAISLLEEMGQQVYGFSRRQPYTLLPPGLSESEDKKQEAKHKRLESRKNIKS